LDSHKKIIAGIHSLEPLPAVCTRVMQLAGNETVVPTELVSVIQSDVAITAKVLRICNSAYYGFARQVTSLDEAGNRLGVNTLVNLVLTACSGSYFKSFGKTSQARAKELRERSVSNALSASLLAGIQGDIDKNAAYTVGLLQDIGEVVLERFLPAEAKEIQLQLSNGLSQTEVEANLLGEDHAHIGARLAEQWDFPDSLVDAIRFHHAPSSASVAPGLACAANIADSITMAMAHGGQGDGGSVVEITDEILKLVGLEAIGSQSLESQIHAELERARELIGG